MNDMAALHGLETVARLITGAVMGEPAHEADNAPDTLMEGTTNGNEAETIARLAALPPVEYDRTRKTESEALGIRPATLDKLVIQARKVGKKTGLDFDDIEPWAHPVNAAELLTEVSATVRRFIICQPETADAVAL